MTSLQQQIKDVYYKHRNTQTGFICYYDVSGKLRDIRYSSDLGRKFIKPLYYDRSSMRVAVKQSDYSWDSPSSIEVVEWNNKLVRAKIGWEWTCYGRCSTTNQIKSLCYKYNCSPSKAIIQHKQEIIRNKIERIDKQIERIDKQKQILIDELDSLDCCIATEHKEEGSMVGDDNQYNHYVL